jgi:hypothetical protein
MKKRDMERRKRALNQRVVLSMRQSYSDIEVKHKPRELNIVEGTSDELNRHDGITLPLRGKPMNLNNILNEKK